jgi:hypothetical protein
MKKRGDIERYTAEEIDEMLAAGESRADWEAVKAMTEEEPEASIAADPDDVGYAADKAMKGLTLAVQAAGVASTELGPGSR